MKPQPCRVYWGSHACSRPRGHAGHHLCECAAEGEPGNVGGPPYYGPDTHFYGEDAYGGGAGDAQGEREP